MKRNFASIIALIAIFAATFATAEPRIALVIGNSAYENVAQLDNPVTDANDMAATLTAAGFDVTLLLDASQPMLNFSIAKFGKDLRDAGRDATGLFYYAGHGVQSFGTNYLVPVDAALKNAADLDLVAIAAESVLRQMKSARNKTNIVILDACRDNPFETILDMDDNGLAEMNAPTGTFLSYSTAPGAVALDGLDGNSPFTKALLKNIPEPGMPIEQLFKAVRIEVLKETGGAQVPWDASSLTGNFNFVEAAPVPAPAPMTNAGMTWEAVRDTKDPLQILLFLRAYPDSQFAGPAREMLNALMVSELSPPSPSEQAAIVPDKEPAAPTSVTLSGSTQIAAEVTDTERALIETARKSGKASDYQAYVDAYPSGAYAELAAFELALLKEKEGGTTMAALPSGDRALQVVVPEVPGMVPPTSVITYNGSLETGGAGIVGNSLESLITGSPTYPPIEGLPESVWKDATCSTCHQWTREALCTQAQTYLAAEAPALAKTHPLGGGFKHNLKYWAQDGCQ
ncbi:caspase family protein (plasmid) [Rhodobacteraceae bacterium SC52]|nr:caspase family protein [Rhodobacteraceae bacterium SC52]